MSLGRQQSTHFACEYRKPPTVETLRLLKKPELLTKVESVNYSFKTKTILLDWHRNLSSPGSYV